MRRSYHSDRPIGDLMADVAAAGDQRTYRRAYMRFYRATHPDLRAAELALLLAYKRGIAEADAELAVETTPRRQFCK